MKLIFLLQIILAVQIFAISKFQEQYRWQQIDYEYPTEQHRIHALRTGKFIPANNLPVGIEVWNDKLFVSVPRWRPGMLEKIKIFCFIYNFFNNLVQIQDICIIKFKKTTLLT